ncbi:flagellar biosynthesis protein FlhF [Hymenobacter crusticola]|uniref:Uncharacterized protein n=1 Tax=Hymenobacter crusticola TaxID=1770526 RepID=A0A243W8R5_9BACT|nr:hypothetical protein [Hymenobacter crusticola]OUJ71773.1 hypothetical protein BXP70_20675 [Hymenobacter crusticola]
MPEKLQTLLVIFIGLLALVVRWWKKAQETTQRERQERRITRPDSTGQPRPVAPGLPATSFGELLKQMQAQNQQGAAPRSPAPPVATTVETTPGGRPLPREKARSTRSLERTEVRPVSLEAPATARPLDAAPPVRQRAAALPRATAPRPEDYWSRQAAPTVPSRVDTRRHVTDLLRSPADIRAAFVLGEIFKRKYE